MKSDVLFSIIVVNYNGKRYVDRCVESIFRSRAADFEVIVCDNGSTDGSADWLEEKFGKDLDRLKVVRLRENLGPAAARNMGAHIARGRYLGFLDNDTEVHPDWAGNAMREFENDPALGIIQCKLLLLKERNKIDYVGEYLGQNGFLVQRSSAGEVDVGQYDQKVDILAAKSAGMFIRRDVFERIGGFDDDYFIYVEETDLGWRSWLAGFKARFVPDSIVFHEFGTSTIILGKNQNNYNAKFHGTKNYILTLLKNLEFGNALKIIPRHVLLWAGLAWFSLAKGDWRAFGWIHSAIWWNVRNARRTMRKRWLIQECRVLNDKALFRAFMRKMPMSYFVRKATRRQKVGNAEGYVKSS